MIKKLKNQSGYTLMEILVAAAIFAIITTIAGTTMINLYQAQRKERLASDLFEESRFLIERIVREIRVNTIDYEEYYSKIGLSSETYGENPRAYERGFWRIDVDGNLLKNEGCFNTMANNDPSDDDCDENALDNYTQQELYLISPDGKTKTIIKKINNGIDDDYDGDIDNNPYPVGEDGLEWVAIAKMVVDGENWVPHEDFDNTTNFINITSCNNNNSRYWINDKCLQFISISHPLLTVEDLTFYLSPLEDPRKAFNEDNKDIQQHPHVTLTFQAKTNREVENTLINFVPRISIQTTVSPRVYNNVIFP